jgi:PAS domain S-box-containing protein
LERPTTRRVLEEQQEWFRVTLASIGDAVIATDTAGKVIFVNAAAEALTGWTADDAAGEPVERVFRILQQGTQNAVTSPAASALREERVIGPGEDSVLVARDGSRRAVEESAAPIRDAAGAVLGAVLVFRDVTERRASEQALRNSEERFRLLVDGTRDHAIFVLDAQGHIASWNAGAERIKGWSASEIIGQHFSVFYPPDAVASGWPQEELRRATAEGRFEDEGWRVRKDGTRFWANVVITALRWPDGSLRGFSKITRDLTQRRQLERARVEAELLTDLNRRKDEFLAMLSHELRNPLAPILNAVQLLSADLGGTPVQREARAIIERQVGQLREIVDDLLEVARVTTGNVRLRPEHLDLRGVVDRAVQTTRPQVDRHGHQLAIDVPPAPVWVVGDATRLEQVVVNLIGNAAKYTEPGGRITLAVRREGADAVVRVRDTGVGIASDLLPHVFDLFTQAQRSLDRSEGGLGIGLSVVQRLVELHGGRAEAHSEGIGKGSEFVIRLSAAEEPAPVPMPRVPTAVVAHPLRILVVDDNHDAADSTAMLLRHVGHEVFVAYTGREGLEQALALRPQAVLLDIGLPEMDGYEVARRLRASPGLGDMRLVAVSGYGQEADRQRSREAGFDAHMVKPVGVQQMLSALAS